MTISSRFAQARQGTDRNIKRKKITGSRLLVMAVALTVAGCATTSNTQGMADADQLYEGKSTTAFIDGTPPKSVVEAIKRGDLALQKGDSDRALFEYIRALELDEKSVNALFKIGAIHASRGNWKLARTAYERALAVKADHVPSLQGLGMVELEQRQYKQAETHFQAAIDADREQLQAAEKAAQEQMKGDKKSEKAPSEPVDNSLYIARSYNGLGMIHDLRSEYEQAREYYQRALAIRPRSISILNNLGYSRYLAGDWRSAERYFRKVLSLDSNYNQAWTNLGLLYTRQGRYNIAFDTFKRVMDQHEAYNNMGYICMLTGKYVQAESFFQKAISASPTYYVSAHKNLEQNRMLQNRGTVESVNMTQ